MPLELIAGPPNSGRAGKVRAWIGEHAAAGREPLLVVPTATDVQRFRRELAGLDGGSGREAVALGAEAVGFGALFAIIARTLAAGVPARLDAEQRAALLRRVIATTELEQPLADSAERPGFAVELDRLISDLQAARADPGAIPAEVRGRPALGGLARLWSAYLDARDGLSDRTDAHGIAAAATDALAARPGAWDERPVAFYGFDDMTGEQLRAVEALAAAAEVLVTVTFEDREALAERARLRNELIDRCGPDVAEQQLERNPAYTASPLLGHLERELFALQPAAPDAVTEGDDGLVVLESAGRRVQAEQLAIEVARLLIEEGQRPDEVMVAVRSPRENGPLIASVLADQGVPAALQADVAVADTAVGRGLIGLIRSALPDGEAADLLAFLRAPGVAGPGRVDGFELALLRAGTRGGADAARLWDERQASENGGRPLRELEALAGAEQPADALAELRRVARAIAERPQQRLDGARETVEALELRSAAAIGTALEAIAELDPPAGVADALNEALAMLETLELPALQGAGEGRVLISSPRQIRARPVANLFVLSVQEGEFPRPERADPLVLDRDRGLLGLPGRASHEAEERFLFYSCVSRPTRRLYLCWRSAEEDGKAAGNSSFLEEVGRAIDPEAPLEAIGARTRRRELDRVAPDPEEAGTPRQLARALAERYGDEAAGAAAGTTLDEETASYLAEALRDSAAANAKPGPLTDPGVIARLAERPLFGTSTLEEWLSCPYRWFVHHELAPRPLGPDPDNMAQGGLAHSVLERLYEERPGGSDSPTPATLVEWVERSTALTAELAPSHGLGENRPRDIAARSRVAGLVARFVRGEAELAADRRLHPARFEAAFGEADDDEKPPLQIGDFGLHGKIDRIDLSADGKTGAIFDYKTSREVSIGKHLATREAIAEHGKLQPGLYAIALRELWGVEPLAALYYALGASGPHVARGIARKDELDGDLAGLGIPPGARDDQLDPDKFAAALDAASATAAEVVAGMRAGLIDRVPLGGDCGYCEFSSVCRIERAARIDPEKPDRDEETVE